MKTFFTKAAVMISVSCAFSITYGQKRIAESGSNHQSFFEISSFPAQDFKQYSAGKNILSSKMSFESRSDSNKKQSTKGLINVPSKDINLILTTGVSYASDYASAITSAFERNEKEISGFKGWLNLGIGLEFRVFKSLYLTPSFSAQGSLIKFPDPFLPSFSNTGKSDMNVLYSFGYGCSYYLPVGRTSIYFNLSGLSNIAKSDEDLKRYDFEYKADINGYKCSIGIAIPYSRNSSGILELGYKQIPVKITSWDPDEYSYKVETKNFGGIFLNACWNIGLIKF